jgi:hypothetical protein
MHAGTPEFQARTNEAWQQLRILSLGRAERRDSVVRKIAAVVKGAGIAEIARRMQLGGGCSLAADAAWRRMQLGGGCSLATMRRRSP